jgi:hypothetical protein
VTIIVIGAVKIFAAELADKQRRAVRDHVALVVVIASK